MKSDKKAKSGKVKLRKEHEDFLREFRQMADKIRGCSVEDLRENIAGVLETIMQGFFVQMEASQKNFVELRNMTLKFVGGELNKRQEGWENMLEAMNNQVSQNSAALLSCLLRTYVIEQCLISKGIAQDKSDCREVGRIPTDELKNVLGLFGMGINDLQNISKQVPILQ